MNKPITEICGYPYPNPFSRFRICCSNYHNNQYLANKIEQSLSTKTCLEDQVYDYSSGCFRRQEDLKKRYEILQKNMHFVTNALQQVRIFYGEDAAKMLEEAYIQGISRKKLAQKYQLSENELQKKYREWLTNTLVRDSEVIV